MATEQKEVILEGLKLIEVLDNDDGSAELVFDISDKWKEDFKSLFGYKRFTKKRFENFITTALENALEEWKDV